MWPINYAGSNEDFKNRQRGFNQHVDISSGPLNAACLRNYCKVRHQALVNIRVHLSEALDGPNRPTMLAVLQRQRDAVKQAGIEVVSRSDQ